MGNEANALFSYSVRLSHLSTDAAVQGVAYEPSTLTVVNLKVSCLVFLRVLLGEFRLAVDIQVGCHPVTHINVSGGEF